VSPTVRHDASALGHDLAHRSRTRAARAYALALLAAAGVLVVVLVAAGAPLPRPGPLLLLAVPLALCINRYVFFPNETGVTADAAVLFAAMVAFRGDAPWVGPLLLALLVGPLDARHWHERSFARMAYNSGATALVTAAGLAVFVPLGHELGPTWTATVAAAAAASVLYVLTESVFGVALVALLGEPASVAVRQQARLNSIAVPLAIGGALAGLAAVDVGWWCSFALLLPAAWFPELVLVVLPRRVRVPAVGWVALAAAGVVVVAGLGTVPWTTLPALAAIGVLVGLDGRGLRWCPFPVLGVVAVVPAAVVPPAPDRPLAVALALAAAVAASWGSGIGRRVHAGAVVWCAPLFLASWCAAQLWRDLDTMGASVFTLGMAGALVAAAAWGAPPWGSRHLGRWSTEHLDQHRRGLLALLVALMVFTLVASIGFDDRVIAVWPAQVLFAVALVAVRQWRFAPRRRWLEATALLAGSVTAAVTPAGLVVTPLAVWIAWRAPRS
jgi:hypothetical protein